MARIFLALAAAILVAFGLYSLGVTSGDDYYRQQRKALELEREQQRADLDAQWAPFRTAVGNIAAATMVFVVIAIAAGMGVLALAMFRNRLTLVRPDAAGRMPLPLDDPTYMQAAVAALAAFHHTELERAAQSAHVPASVSTSYAPHLSYEYEHTETRATSAGTLVAEDPVEPALPGLTDAATLMHIPTKHSILLALGPGGQPLTVALKDLWHIGLAGPTGYGKSNIARLILPQLLRLGAKVAIADPKWTPYDAEADEDWRPIADRLHLTAAYKSDAIRDVLQWHIDELDQRIERRNAGRKLGSPLFLYLDETTTITADVKDAEAQIARLTRMGRGVGIFLLTAAHNFLVKSGMGDTRDQLRTTYYLGGDGKTGSVLLDMPQRDIDESHLAPGIALLRSVATQPPRFVRVPLASNSYVYQSLTDTGQPLAEPVAINAPVNETSTDDKRDDKRTDTAAGRHTPSSVQDARILTLARQGIGISQIVKEIWGVQGGPKYAERSAEVMRVLVTNLREGA